MMEYWNGGRMEYWNDGIMENWKDGRMEYWNNGMLEEWIYLKRSGIGILQLDSASIQVGTI